MQRNAVSIDPGVLQRVLGNFDFDLYGSAVSSLAHAYPLGTAYRFRRLTDCPRPPASSVAVVPWNRILPTL
jgi:hypothetical protein